MAKQRRGSHASADWPCKYTGTGRAETALTFNPGAAAVEAVELLCGQASARVAAGE